MKLYDMSRLPAIASLFRWMALCIVILYSSISLLTAQTSLSVHAAFISGQNQLAIADQRNLQIFDMNFQLQKTIPIVTSTAPNAAVTYLSWGRTGDYFIVAHTGSSDPEITSTDVEVLQIRRFSDNQILAEFSGLSYQSKVALVAWSINDGYVAIGSETRVGDDLIKIVTPQDGDTVNEIIIPQGQSLYALRWNPVTLELAAAISEGDDDFIWFCEPTEQLSQCSKEGPFNLNELGMQFSPDGTQLAFLPPLTNTIAILDLNTMGIVRTLVGHSGFIQQLSWSTGGIATTATDKTLRVWNPANGQAVSVTNIDGYVSTLEWSQDGTRIMVLKGPETPELRDGQTGAILAEMCDSCVQSFSLINADTDTPIRTLTNNETFELGQQPTRNLNIRAEVSGQVSQVDFTITPGTPSSDATFPFALVPDTNGNYPAWTPTAGSYTLSATPYSADNVAGTPLTLNFTVTDTTCTTTIANGNIAGLRSAITTANGSGTPSTICLATNGTYTVTDIGNPNGSLGDSGFAAITKNITIFGNGATIQRNATVHFRFFRVASGGTLTLNNLTLKNGFASSPTFGGAIRADSSTLILNNVQLIGNYAEAGGAILANNSPLTVTNSALYGNVAENSGGAIYSNSSLSLTNVSLGYPDPANATLPDATCPFPATRVTDGNCAKNNAGAMQVFNTTSSATLTNVTITKNRAANSGGGVYFTDSASLSITDSTISGNTGGLTAGVGGGMFLKNIAANLYGVTIGGNTGWNGAGLFTEDSNPSLGRIMHFYGVTIENNLAVNRGGGVYNSSADLAFAADAVSGDWSEIHNNGFSGTTTTDRDGGGIFSVNSTGSITASQTAFTNNTALDQGGAIYLASGTANISASCLSGNTAPFSSGIHSAVASPAFNASNNWWNGGTAPTTSSNGQGMVVNNTVTTTGYSTVTSCPSN
jgi:predicted outer membrane repeat protein